MKSHSLIKQLIRHVIHLSVIFTHIKVSPKPIIIYNELYEIFMCECDPQYFYSTLINSLLTFLSWLLNTWLENQSCWDLDVKWITHYNSWNRNVILSKFCFMHYVFVQIPNQREAQFWFCFPEHPLLAWIWCLAIVVLKRKLSWAELSCSFAEHNQSVQLIWTLF